MRPGRLTLAESRMRLNSRQFALLPPIKPHGRDSFQAPRGVDRRARDALRQVSTSVLFGITITKVIGLSVLTLADSRVFKKYYFRMYMIVVLCGVLNGMLLLPVLLSTIIDVKNFFLHRGPQKTALRSAPVTRTD